MQNQGTDGEADPSDTTTVDPAVEPGASGQSTVDDQPRPETGARDDVRPEMRPGSEPLPPAVSPAPTAADPAPVAETPAPATAPATGVADLAGTEPMPPANDDVPPSVMERMFEIDPASGESALLPQGRLEPSDAEKESRFAERLAEMRSVAPAEAPTYAEAAPSVGDRVSTDPANRVDRAT